VRPVLVSAVRQLWRDPRSLQLGRGSGRSAVVAGLDAPLRATLRLLDGTRDREQVLRAARDHGCSPARASELLELLDSAGLLADGGQDRSALLGLAREERERLAPDVASLALVRGDGGTPALALRRAVEVLVVGAGRVGVPIALALAAAGIGTVDVADDGTTRPQDTAVGGLGPADVGRPRGQAARELLRRVVPSLGGGPVVHPHLVVLAAPDDDVRERSRRLVLAGTPHLVVEVRDTTGVVGPLVLPGRTPCLRCLDLTRSDLDPAWPVLAAQLAAGGPAAPACDGPLALAVAAQAAMQVLAVVDGTAGARGCAGRRAGRPASATACAAASGPGPAACASGCRATASAAALGGTLEMSLPDWRWRRRSWPLHPDCGCTGGTA
jgi:hypothetical protein